MYRELKTRVISFISDNQLITPGDKIIVATSGGMDSMFLLHLLQDIKSDMGIELVVGHINHNIRKNSDFDEKFVIDQSEILKIHAITKQLEYDKDKVKNIESWARKNRYLALETIRDELGFNKIVTAHHQNDQIESILQRLSEKSGIGGLRGIHKQIGNVIRPLLSVSRKEIEEAVDELNIQYIEDETNKDETLKRNYFRHQVIPKWKEMYPNLGDSFQSVTENVEDHLNVLEYFFKQLEDSIVIDRSGAGEIKLNIKGIKKIPLSVFSSFIKYLLDDGNWRKHQWIELRNILSSASYGKIYTFNDFEILKDRKEWIIRPKLKVHQEIFNIEIGQVIDIDNFSLAINEVNKPVINADSNVEYIDKEKINTTNLAVRFWQDGDVFQPLGMNGKKKVSDYLIDEKVNSFDKQKQLVLTADDEIIWLCGHRVSEKVKIDDNSKHYLELSIKSNVG